MAKSIISSPRKLSRQTWLQLKNLELNGSRDPTDRVATELDLHARDPKPDCRLTTVANMANAVWGASDQSLTAAANGAMANIDGVAPVVGDRILNQHPMIGGVLTTKYRGIYEVVSIGGLSSKWKIKRVADANTSAKVTSGLLVHVTEGSTKNDSWWTLTTNNPIVLDTTALVFSESSGAGFATYAALASTANGQGASLLGLEDPDGLLTAGTVEAAFKEVRTVMRTTPSTEKTVAGGVLTVDSSHHSADTEADAASDDVDTISGLVDGQVLILKLENAARNIVLKHNTGNVICPYGMDVTLDVAGDRAVLLRSGTNVYVIALNLASASGGGIGAYLASILNGKGASGIGFEDAQGLYAATNLEAAMLEVRTKLQTISGSQLTIAGGIVTATQSHHNLTTEGGAASDDLDTINGLAAGQLIMLGLVDAAKNVVLKHGTGNISCHTGRDITLDAASDEVIGFYDGATLHIWPKLAVDPLEADLASTANGKGASKLGVQDAGGLLTAANVEAALAELATAFGGVRDPSLSLAAEVANVRRLTVTVKNLAGTTIEAAQKIKFEARKADGSFDATAVTLTGVVAQGTVLAGDASGELFMETKVDGTCQVDVTDVPGASGLTFHLLAKCLNVGSVPRYLAAAFD